MPFYERISTSVSLYLYLKWMLTRDCSVMVFMMMIVELFNDAKRPRIRFMSRSLFYLILLETVIY